MNENSINKVEIKLSKRLQTIADFVRLNGFVADIGTDHALLPCYLEQQGCVRVMASDVNAKPLEAARRTAALYNIEGVEFVLSDGLDNIPPCDDVIIAGMGGELIADILSRCHFKNSNTRFILQPMTKPELLRSWLYENGYYIDCEKSAADNGKIYSIMLCGFDGEKKSTDDCFNFCGKNTDKIYIERQLVRLKKMAKGNPDYNATIKKIEEEILTNYE